MRSIGLKHILTIPALLGGAFPALAQTAPTREEIERAPVAPLPPSGQRVTVEGEVERAPCPLADAQYQSITVTLSGVEFANLGSISPDLLRGSYSDLIGQTVPIATVCEIRDRAATILRREGYLAAVQVPPQKIDNGIVKFDVLMAKLVGFQVRGDAGKSEGIIQGYLSAIQDQPVFNILDAERYLLLARDLPGFDVRLTLRPAGTVPGEVIGEVQVVRIPFDANINIQNYGSREVGRFGGLAQVHLNGIFGMGDRTTLGYFTTSDFEEQHVLQAAQEIRVGREGLTLGANFTYAWTKPDLGAMADLRSETLVAGVNARFPLIRRQAHNLVISGGFDYIDQTARFNAPDPFSEDNLRVGYVRLDYDSIDPQSLVSTVGYSGSEPRWRFGGNIELRQGVDIFGATKRCVNAQCSSNALIPTRPEADPTAFVARAAAYAEFRPIPMVGFSLQPRAQYAPKAVLSYEEFSVGNYTIGRGYDPGTLIGDSGVGVRGEFTIGSLVPKSRKAFAVQGYAFGDAAWVWNEDLPANDPFRKGKLQSAGGGVRAAYGDRFQLDAGVAVPLKRVGAIDPRRGDARFLVTLTAKLLPWNR